MEIVELIREYQHFNPATGRFNAFRQAAEYAAMLGVSPAALSRVYSGQRRPSATLLLGFLRAFPVHGLAALGEWLAMTAGDREVA